MILYQFYLFYINLLMPGSGVLCVPRMLSASDETLDFLVPFVGIDLTDAVSTASTRGDKVSLVNRENTPRFGSH